MTMTAVVTEDALGHVCASMKQCLVYASLFVTVYQFK